MDGQLAAGGEPITPGLPDYTKLPHPDSVRSEFCNLHVHSEGSFLDGFSKVTQIARRAKELGQGAVAITDHGEVNQHLAFQKACQAEGIKPLLGIEGYWAPSVKAIVDACQGKGNSGKWGAMMSHICLIAQNDEGLRNLWALSSTAYDEHHFYHRPVADPALLRQYASGLWASDGCLMTAFGLAVEAGDEDAARQYLAGLRDIFRERFYVELHTWQYMHPSNDEKVKFGGQWISTVQANAKMTVLNRAKVQLATEMGIPMVVVNDSHHAYPEHWKLKEMVWGFKADSNPDQMEGSGQKADHLMGDDELYYWMGRHGIGRDIVAEAIKYSGQIAERCNTEIKPMLRMPNFTKSEADDYALFLEHVERGFKDRVERAGLDVEQYRARLESEVRLIADKRFAGYFLVVEDVIDAAKTGRWTEWVHKPRTPRDPMDIAPGRGSVGGSLVAYVLGITNLDPIKYGLLFERFLTPERAGFPDIDIDFPKDKRAGIKAYTQKRWGEDHVCSICTMNRNQAKGTVNDLGRALGIDYADLQAISKLIEQYSQSEMEEEESSEDTQLTWEEIAERDTKGALAPYIREYPALFQGLGDLTGTIRQTGVHPAAVLISDKPLYEVIPTRVKNGTLTTAFDMYDIEELGGLKMDYLSTRHLVALAIARDLVEQRHGIKLDYDSFGDKEYADPAIWTQIDEGRTTGIFQLGTPGGTDSAIEFQPRSERDVSDLIAINRPGVRDAGLYHVYLRRRAGVQPIEYDHPLMENIVGDTFGVLIYQEQLMEAAKVLANFTLVEADALRKAVSKKIMAKVLAMKDKFIDGCLDNVGFIRYWNGNNRSLAEIRQLAREVAEKVWASIEASGRYLFNRSHSQGYSLTACREIWMKHYYPAEMLVGFMRAEEDKKEKVNAFVREARRLKINILPPDINISGATFTIVGNDIRYGLEAVRGIGKAASKKLLSHQPYRNVEDLMVRANPNKTAMLNLAKLGAMDCLGDRVRVMREIEWYRAAEGLAPSTLGDFDKLQGEVSRRLVESEYYQIEIPDFNDDMVVYGIEQELVGSFVTVDPMGPYIEIIDREAINNPGQLRKYLPGQKLVLGGQIVKVNEHVIKRGYTKGQKMAFMTVEWQGDSYDVTVFAEAYRKYELLMLPGAPVLCGCERTEYKGQPGASLVELFRLDILCRDAQAVS